MYKSQHELLRLVGLGVLDTLKKKEKKYTKAIRPAEERDFGWSKVKVSGLYLLWFVQRCSYFTLKVDWFAQDVPISLCPGLHLLWFVQSDFRNFVQGVSIPFWKNFGSFQSISSVSRRFSKYQLKFKIWPAWSLCLKKKIFLKPKQICILYTEKLQKEKKWKENKWTKVAAQ